MVNLFHGSLNEDTGMYYTMAAHYFYQGQVFHPDVINTRLATSSPELTSLADQSNYTEESPSPFFTRYESFTGRFKQGDETLTTLIGVEEDIEGNSTLQLGVSSKNLKTTEVYYNKLIEIINEYGEISLNTKIPLQGREFLIQAVLLYHIFWEN